MSRQAVEIIEAAYDAVRRREADWPHRVLPADIEWHPAPQSPDYEVRYGPRAVSEYFDRVLEDAVLWEPRIASVTEVGEGTYLIDAEATAESRHGVTGEFTFSQVWEFRDERPVRVREFLDRSEAVEAAGLSE